MTPTRSTKSTPSRPTEDAPRTARTGARGRIESLRSRFVVTGCAGFIGSHLTEVLLGGGHEVIGVDAFTDYYPRALKEANLATALASPRFTLVEADLAEADLTGILPGAAGVFHLAARPGVRSSWGDTFGAYVRDNLLATQRLFGKAANTGLRIVFASSSSVYGNAQAHPTPESATPLPISPYGVTKLGCEHLAQAYASCFDLDFVALRYFTVYGPRQRPDMAFARLTDAVNTGSSFHLMGNGRQSRDFTFVGDAVAATLAAMKLAPSGAIYNVGGGSEVTILDAIGLCERLAGRSIDVLTEAEAAGDVRRTSADTSRIRAELGWSPQTTLEDGLAAQVGLAGTSLPRATELASYARQL